MVNMAMAEQSSGWKVRTIRGLESMDGNSMEKKVETRDPEGRRMKRCRGDDDDCMLKQQ